MSNCPIMQRIKNNYENRSQVYLTRRTPVICRIDGKNFSRLTRNMKKPFDENFINIMQMTAMRMCKEIQGCKFGYVFSDEISLLITDYETLTTEGWFDYNLQKMVSVSASLATFFFNKLMGNGLALDELAVFDSRAFSIPKEEVCNYFIARQKDCAKNSISGLAQSLFPHKELQNLNSIQLQEKMIAERKVVWDDLDIWKKRGTAILKRDQEIINPNQTTGEFIFRRPVGIKVQEGIDFEVSTAKAAPLETFRSKWETDINPPIFSLERNYIESLI